MAYNEMGLPVGVRLASSRLQHDGIAVLAPPSRGGEGGKGPRVLRDAGSGPGGRRSNVPMYIYVKDN